MGVLIRFTQRISNIYTLLDIIGLSALLFKDLLIILTNRYVI